MPGVSTESNSVVWPEGGCGIGGGLGINTTTTGNHERLSI